MKTIKNITDDKMISFKDIDAFYENNVFKTYKEAVKFGRKTLGFKKSDIIERKTKTKALYNRGIVELECYCVYVDSGSDDYVYFFQY